MTSASSDAGSIPAAVAYMMGSTTVGFNDRHQAMTSGKIAQPESAGKPLTDAAKRALAEAAERRGEYRRREAGMPREIGGRGGNEPGRYGDWEVKGIASDF
jgi:hypothetical protein